jgi:hypothetical protein
MLYQLRHYRAPSAHDLPALVQFAGEHLVPGLQAAGVRVIGCFTTSIGSQPRFSMLLGFPDPNAWLQQLDAFEASDAWQAMEPGLYPEDRALVTGYQTILLRQTSFSAEVTASLGAAEPGVFEERVYYGMDPRAHARNLQRTGEGTSHVQRRAGMHLVAYWEIVAGAEQPADALPDPLRLGRRAHEPVGGVQRRSGARAHHRRRDRRRPDHPPHREQFPPTDGVQPASVDAESVGVYAA